jgi:hypothetical protein
MSSIRRLSAQQCKAIFAHLVNLADARSRLRLPHHDRPFCLQMTKLFLRYIKADMSGYFFNLRQRADEPSKLEAADGRICDRCRRALQVGVWHS